jgi:hypothetical protein
MLTVTENVTQTMDSIKSAITPEAENMLDRIAATAESQLMSRAPKGRSGNLFRNITIGRSRLTRVIEPTAQNPSGGKYALPVETGWGPSFPNVDNIGLYYGVDKRLAFAIAAGIAKVKHAPQEFVKPTLEYLFNTLNTYISEFSSKIMISVRTK